MSETPLTIHIEGNRITKVACANKKLEKDFWAYTHTDENSDRVGEFAIGTNIGVERVIGKYSSGREVSRGAYRVRGSIWGAHGGEVEVVHAH